MSRSDTFIKDIENYFLKISKKGVMLSSKDYFLIREWMERGLSREQIYRGISNAFEQKTTDRIKNIFDCKEYVESCEIKENISETFKSDAQEAVNYIEHIVNNFEKIITDEKHHNLLKLHNNYRERVLSLKSSGVTVFEEINKIEEEYFSRFLKFLDKEERVNIEKKIIEAVNSGNDYINEQTKKKALNNYLKNLIIKEYIYFNPFETDK